MARIYCFDNVSNKNNAEKIHKTETISAEPIILNREKHLLFCRSILFSLMQPT